MSEKIVSIGDDETTVSIETKNGSSSASAGGRRIVLVSATDEEAILEIGGRRVVVPFVVTSDGIQFQYAGEVYTATVEDKGRRSRKRHHDHSMSAPMPGVVLKLMAKPGDTVTKGAPLLVLEAMKMEHQITAPRDGVIKSVNCKEGELVQPGVDLIELEEQSSP